MTPNIAGDGLGHIDSIDKPTRRTFQKQRRVDVSEPQRKYHPRFAWVPD